MRARIARLPTDLWRPCVPISIPPPAAPAASGGRRPDLIRDGNPGARGQSQEPTPTDFRPQSPTLSHYLACSTAGRGGRQTVHGPLGHKGTVTTRVGR